MAYINSWIVYASNSENVLRGSDTLHLCITHPPLL